MASIEVGKQYYAMVQGNKAIVTIKGESPNKPGFWSCELAAISEYLTSFCEIELPTEDIITSEVPPEMPDACS